MSKINILIIGSGHYVTGMTTLSGQRKTDKDSGVFLPAVFALHAEGFVGEIGIAARDGAKLLKLKKEMAALGTTFGWSDEIKLYPRGKIIDDSAFRRALSEMPKPCAALIAVPDFLHKSAMLECIKKGVPFLVVKPALTRLNDFYAVVKAMKEKPVFGMVDYHKVFDEANILLRSEYQSGEYGQINHIYSLMTQRRDMLEIYERWLKKDRNLNVNHYLGSHYIHLTGFMTGAEPIDVRATAQNGEGTEPARKNVADLIETHIRWRSPSGHEFASYHIAGWNDPVETESMTYQEIRLLCENGHVDSDQRYRGIRKIIAGKGYEAPNPYFFNLTRNPSGKLNLNVKYGYLSVKSFVQAVLDILTGKSTISEFEKLLPTIAESEKVTAILEAADYSLKNNSKIVKIFRKGERYILH
jgi:predicted dehydrogenase